MKGIVFTEFLEMIEQNFGLALCDHLIESSELPSKGIYTSVGTYDPSELITMIQLLSDKKNIPCSDLVKSFGHHLYQAFKKNYAYFFEQDMDALAFLPRVHDVIHVEVKKLYPDAALPEFSYKTLGQGLEMIYRSKLGMADLAEGLIQATLDDDPKDFVLYREDQNDQSMSISIFTIIKRTNA
jgi:hypothetical protein